MVKKDIFKKAIICFTFAAIIAICTLKLAETNTYVYEIESEQGFSENIIKTINRNDEVYNAYGVFKKSITKDLCILSYEGSELKIISGRKPERINEIIISNDYASNNKYQLGDTLSIDSVDYKITGIYEGDININTVGYALSSNFDSLAYDCVIVSSKNKTNIKEILSESENELKEARKQEITNFKNEQINQLDDKRKVIEDAIDTYNSEVLDKLKDAEELINKSQKQLNDSKKQLDDANAQLIDGKKTLEDSKSELDSGEKQLKQAKSQIESAKKQLNQKLNEYGVKENELDGLLSNAEQQFAQSGYSIEFIKNHTDTIYSMNSHIDSLNGLINDALDILNTTPIDQDELDKVWKDIQSEYSKIEDFIPSGYKLELSVYSLSVLQKQILPGLNNNTDNLKQLVEMTVYIDGIKEAINVRDQIASSEKQYEKKTKEYESGKKKYEDGLEEYNKKLDEYNSAYKTYLSKKNELDDGKDEYDRNKYDYDKQINDFNSQLEDIDSDKKLLKDEIGSLDIEWSYSECLGSSKTYAPTILIFGALILFVGIGFVIYRGFKNGR